MVVVVVVRGWGRRTHLLGELVADGFHLRALLRQEPSLGTTRKSLGTTQEYIRARGRVGARAQGLRIKRETPPDSATTRASS